MDKDLKKLSRMELLELLVKASEMNKVLISENESLRGSVSAQRQQLQQQQRQPQRLPKAAKVGSIAEAALQVNGYFDAAQRAADDYLREIKYLRDQIAARAAAAEKAQAGSSQQVQQASRSPQQVNGEAYIRDTQAKANAILNQANAQAQAIISDALTRSEAMMADARSQSESMIGDANRQAHIIVAQANRRADALVESASKRDTGQHATGPLTRRGRHVKLADGVVA